VSQTTGPQLKFTDRLSDHQLLKKDSLQHFILYKLLSWSQASFTRRVLVKKKKKKKKYFDQMMMMMM